MSKEPLGYSSAQNFIDSDLAQIHKQFDEEDRVLLTHLKEQQKSLSDRLHVSGAEDQTLGREFDAITEKIEEIEERMKKQGLSKGGRRKKRTHRRSKSRRSKSCAKKSRRSKSRAKKSRRSKH